MAEAAKWYVVHTYSGYENTVMATIEKTVETRQLQDIIQQVSIPMETVTEITDGGEKTVTSGVITGGDAEYGGGVYIERGGRFALEGGSIVGCQAVYTYAGGSGSGGYERSGFERQNTPAPEGFSEIEDDELPF